MDTKIRSSFWSDPDIQRLPAEQKLAFLWFTSNAQISVCGVAEVTPRQFAFETGLAESVFADALKVLPRAFHYVKTGNLVYVRNFVRHQIGTGASLMRNGLFMPAVRAVAAVRSEEVVKEIIADYPEFKALLEELTVTPPPTHPPGTPRVLREGEGEGVREGDQGKEVKEKGGNTDQPSAPEELVNAWNAEEKLPGIRSLTSGRKKTLKLRLSEPFFRDNWKAGIDRILKTPFCLGVNDRKWRADVDWLLQPDSLAKLLEGKYDGATTAALKPKTKIKGTFR